MNHARFLTKELEQLWEDYGVEGTRIRESVMANRLSTHTTKSKKVPLKAKGSKSEVPPKIKTLEDIRAWIGDCMRCGLCEQRNKIVFGSGNPKARLMFVGEGPGANEDASGLPFVGRAGNLLTKIIEAMGYTREEVYIANVVKCRPPENRAPLPAEVEACSPFLREQLRVIQPEVIVALGLSAANLLVGTPTSMANLRSKFHPLPWDERIQIMPTYHPAYLLRNPPAKKFVWDDMKLVKARLEKLH